MGEPLIYEICRAGRKAVSLPDVDVPEAPLPQEALRDDLPLPEVSEIDLVRHYTRLCAAEPLHRHRLLPARLVHDEVQPEGERGRRAHARLRRAPSAPGPETACRARWR